MEEEYNYTKTETDLPKYSKDKRKGLYCIKLLSKNMSDTEDDEEESLISSCPYHRLWFRNEFDVISKKEALRIRKKFDKIKAQ